MTTLALSTAPRARADATGFWSMFALALVAALVVSAPNLLDPLVRHDDYPSLFVEPAGFWDKTLNEGRWVNYLWHLRQVVTPAWFNFLVYQAVWAAIAAGLAVALIPRTETVWFRAALTVLVLIAPPATLLSGWFNTVLPGFLVIAIYAWIVLRTPPKVHRALLPVFVTLSVMAYTTNPLMLLALCLGCTRHRSLRDLAGLLALFVISFVGAVLVTYSINWQVHGVFGVPLAAWRQTTPAHDLTQLVANLPLLGEVFGAFLYKVSFGFWPAAVFHLALFALATGVMLRHARMEAIYLLAGLLAGLGLIVAQVLKLGVDVPPRAFIFAWVFYAVLAVRAAQILTAQGGLAGRMARNAVMLIAASYMLQTAQQYMLGRAWQADTRAMAAAVAQSDGPVRVMGDPMYMASAREAMVQTGLALGYRMQQLAGRSVTFCALEPDRCTDIADLAGTAEGAAFAIHAMGTGTVIVIAPAVPPR